MQKVEVNANTKYILLSVVILILILLSLVNLKNISSTPKKVLGAETVQESSIEFWNSFLSNNPNYIPGLIDSGNINKAKEIDPNYTF